MGRPGTEASEAMRRFSASGVIGEWARVEVGPAFRTFRELRLPLLIPGENIFGGVSSLLQLTGFEFTLEKRLGFFCRFLGVSDLA